MRGKGAIPITEEQRIARLRFRTQLQICTKGAPRGIADNKNLRIVCHRQVSLNMDPPSVTAPNAFNVK